MKFNVISYDWNQKKPIEYDVIPTFVDFWKDKRFDAKKVKTYDEFKEWVKNASMYHFWSRCEYECMIAPWPYKLDSIEKEMKKIDIHQQLEMNFDLVVDVLAKELKLSFKNKL